MPSIEEIVPSLYLLQWTRLELSAEVRTSRQVEASEEMSERRDSLVLDGSGRYRVQRIGAAGDASEPFLEVCDGRACWVITGSVARQFEVANSTVPFAECLSPSWLLADFDLEVTGSTMVADRQGAVVVAKRRETSKSRTVLGLVPDSVTAVVDDEFGFLLRCARTGPRELVQVTEFTRLTVGAGGGLFAPPPGVTVVVEATQASTPAASLTGSAESGRPIGAEQVKLLHRTALGAQEFSADLREWTDNEAIVQVVRAAVDAQGAWRYGILGRFVDVDQPAVSDRVARLHVAMPHRYRIDNPATPSSGSASIVCDGQHQWRISADRVVRRSARALPAGIALTIDPAWMLGGYQVSDEGTAEVDGRRGLRVRAVPEGEVSEMWQSPLSGKPFLAESTEAIIDVELGIALRQTWYCGDQPILVTEFSNISLGVEPATFEVPLEPGTQVLVDPGPLAEAGLSPAGLARHIGSRVAKDLFSRLGGRHHHAQ